MPGGTLIVSRAIKLFPYYQKRLLEFGFKDVEATGEEKDSLNRVIDELKPRLVLVGSGFYHAGTPYMMGRLLKTFPKLNIAAVSLGEFPDELAVWFIWHRVKSYISLWEGYEEFCRGLDEIRQGRQYISPKVRRLMEGFDEWPETSSKVTRRQMEVLILVCNGFIIDNIADTLHISRAAVNWHLDKLYKVFHVDGREDLVKTAFATKLVTDRDMIFYERGKELEGLPEWAVVRKKLNRVSEKAVISGVGGFNVYQDEKRGIRSGR
jgi:DNA-binding NarL/FixJ family response regulator